MVSYGFDDVRRIANVSASQLKYWVREGVVHASGGAETQGTGHHREFELFNIIEAAVNGALHRVGVSLAVMKRVRVVLNLLEFAVRTETVDKTLSELRAAAPEYSQPLVNAWAVWFQKWREIRTPGKARDKYSFCGLLVNPDADAEYKHIAGTGAPDFNVFSVTGLSCVPRGKGFNPSELGAVCVIVNLKDILEQIEAATAEQLPAIAPKKNSRPRREAATV